MPSVALYEAKNKLSGLLDQVATGEQVTITRHGKAAALLVPADQGFDRAKARQAAATLVRIRRGSTLGGLSAKQLAEEGRP